ncbi:hypothetical protein ABH922_005132 [Rhodococcus sp. 27YEA15]|uniref:nucleotide exchange factor GrpE n=1 Tax=Rhodococcus sp. 27YEA15 TaxID=3156259 RepID=UPI003C7CA50B
MLITAAAALFVFAAGVGTGWMLRWQRRRTLDLDRVFIESFTEFTDAVPSPSGDAGALRDLTHTLIDIYNDIGEGAIRDRIVEDLDHAGIHPVAVRPGVRFHSSYHLAVEHVRATDPYQVGTIAAVLRPGWKTPDGVIRHPEVAVYEAGTPLNSWQRY